MVPKFSGSWAQMYNVEVFFSCMLSGLGRVVGANNLYERISMWKKNRKKKSCFLPVAKLLIAYYSTTKDKVQQQQQQQQQHRSN